MHHLVLADDSSTTQTLVRLSFAEESTIQVHTFDAGSAALEHIQNQPTDVVLVKVELRRPLDGYELCRRIKQEPRTSHIHVLLLSRVHDPFDESRAKEAGFDGLLIKPFETSRLVARIEALLAPVESQASSTETSGKGTVGPPESEEHPTAGPSEVPSEKGDGVFRLHPSQCRPRFSLLPRNLTKADPGHAAKPPSQTGSKPSSSNEAELERLIEVVLERLPQELRRIVPEIAREVLGPPGKPTPP